MPCVRNLKPSETSTKNGMTPRDAISPRVGRSRKRCDQTATLNGASSLDFPQDGIETAKFLTGSVYAELSLIARKHISRERRTIEFDADDLLNEACTRLLKPRKWVSRAQFFKAAGRVMTQVLIDWARRRNTLKRGREWQRVELADVSPMIAESGSDSLTMRNALAGLHATFPRKYHVLVLRGVVGLGVSETAEALGVSLSTVKADWAAASTWMRNEVA